MIVSKPLIEKLNGKIRISSNLILEKKKYEKVLWFEYPESYEKYLASNLDGFVVAAVPIAMTQKEDINVLGTLSEKLVFNLKTFQRYFSKMFPYMEPASISCEGYKIDQKVENKKVLSFSGGADSFFSLQSLLKEDSESYKLTDCLIQYGFDPTLDLNKGIDTHPTIDSYKVICKDLGLNLLTVVNNHRAFIQNNHPTTNDNLKQWHCYGTSLAACALIISKGISKFYIPSASLGNLADGSNPETDYLMSTENLEVIHHGWETTRFNKLKSLSDWPLTFNNLRVCFSNRKNSDELNCCTCEKCMRTMTSLDLLGVLKNYTAFPKPLILKDVLTMHNWDGKRTWGADVIRTTHFLTEILDYAKNIGRSDVVESLSKAFKEAENMIKIG